MWMLVRCAYLCPATLATSEPRAEHTVWSYPTTRLPFSLSTLFSRPVGSYACKLLILNGSQRRDRTADAGLFRTYITCIYNSLEDTDGTVSH
jgi:hypothetical protein